MTTNKINYLITSGFDDFDVGKIIPAQIVKYCDDRNYALVFLPPSNTIPGSCGSLEICRESDSADDIWVGINPDSYINITKSDLKKLINSLQKIHDNWGKK